MLQRTQIELSINSNTTRSQIQINAYVTGHVQGMFYDSKTRLIKFTDWQSGWKSLEQFTDQIKKAKKVLESQKWTFHKGQY